MNRSFKVRIPGNIFQELRSSEYSYQQIWVNPWVNHWLLPPAWVAMLFAHTASHLSLTWGSMSDIKIFVIKCFAVNWVSSGAITVRKVSPLNHEARDDAMKPTTTVPKTLLIWNRRRTITTQAGWPYFWVTVFISIQSCVCGPFNIHSWRSHINESMQHWIHMIGSKIISLK